MAQDVRAHCFGPVHRKPFAQRQVELLVGKQFERERELLSVERSPAEETDRNVAVNLPCFDDAVAFGQFVIVSLLGRGPVGNGAVGKGARIVGHRADDLDPQLQGLFVGAAGQQRERNARTGRIAGVLLVAARLQHGEIDARPSVVGPDGFVAGPECQGRGRERRDQSVSVIFHVGRYLWCSCSFSGSGKR